MSDNPFQSPDTVSGPIDAEVADPARRRSVADILSIAKAQRWVMTAILAYLVTVAIRFGGGPKLAPLIFVTGPVALILGLVGVIWLASLVYRSRLVGVLNGLAMFIPLIGLIILVILNGRATRLLRKYGIRVGLVGAYSEDLYRLQDQ
jgi:hypothetical protein